MTDLFDLRGQVARVTGGNGIGPATAVGQRYLDWDAADPAGESVDMVRPIVDEIERRVLDLLQELGADTAP